MDYTHLYKERLPIDEPWPIEWELFLSAYNPSERVRRVYSNVKSTEKRWILHREYDLSGRTPAGDVVASAHENEADFVRDCMAQILRGRSLRSFRLCVDITGFMRPHLMFLLKFLFASDLRRFDVLYSEPTQYIGLDKAQFSDRSVSSVRQVSGFEGVVNNDTSGDMLVIGVGYESHLIAEVAEDKGRAERVLVLGLPSLSADMYQQSALRAFDAADALGEAAVERCFAPANDPFVTATVLSATIKALRARRRITNLYLSPLATKAQALGFALYHLTECRGEPVSIIFPFSPRYSIDSASGISRIWRFVVEKVA
jgi:hypothetical protein